MNPEGAIGRPQRIYRRRLSAPETIMRKHLLGQERASRDSSNERGIHWTTRTSGSDPNLTQNWRKPSDIRKSTLLRQLWESSKGNDHFPNSYSEWQYLSAHKSRQTSSSELRNSFRSSPVRRRRSPLVINSLKSEEESYSVAMSNLTENSRTELSDSYPLSTETETDGRNNNQVTMDPISNSNQPSDTSSLPLKYQFVINGNQNEYQFVQPQAAPLSEGGRTNLNVITNVELSPNTLNLIFSHVMQDVLQKPPSAPKVQDTLVTQKAYNFHCNIDEATLGKHESQDYLEDTSSHISEVNAGSPYRNRNSSTVPRLSALPRTASMEVNISSNESFEKDSDSSLFDSLDDPSSPRLAMKRTKNVITEKRETKCIVHTKSLTPNVMDHFQKTTKIKKSSVFFVPIDETTTKNANASRQGVSEALPTKLRDKLYKRQLRREEKRLQERMKSFDMENGNTFCFTSPEVSANNSRVRKNEKKPPPSERVQVSAKMKAGPSLPQIDGKKDYDKSVQSLYTQKPLNKYRESMATASNQGKPTPKSFWSPKTRSKTTKDTKSSSPKSQTANDKHIEILEIMEIVDPARSSRGSTKGKSRIPVLQLGTPVKLPRLKQKPTFLDFEELTHGDPKLDQLIANILIDTLNHEEVTNNGQPQPRRGFRKTTRCKTPVNSPENNNNPILVAETGELLTKQANNNLKLREALQNVKLDEIPKGWISFYMLHENKSPDTTSDEDSQQRSKSIPKATEPAYYGTQRILDRRGSRRSADGWSVTFTNNNSNRDPPPEIEMKLRFPEVRHMHRNLNNIKDQGAFPCGQSFETECKNIETEVGNSKQDLKTYQYGTNINRLSILPPRATKTSLQRILLNRQHHCSQLSEKMDTTRRTWPEKKLLAVSGRTLNKIRRLPKLSEENLDILLSNLKQ